MGLKFTNWFIVLRNNLFLKEYHEKQKQKAIEFKRKNNEIF